jgi:hypothetical protein
MMSESTNRVDRNDDRLAGFVQGDCQFKRLGRSKSFGAEHGGGYVSLNTMASQRQLTAGGESPPIGGQMSR